MKTFIPLLLLCSLSFPCVGASTEDLKDAIEILKSEQNTAPGRLVLGFGLTDSLYIPNPSKAAIESGVLPGDQLTHINSTDVYSIAEVNSIIEASPRGQTLYLRFLRNGRQTPEIAVTLLYTSEEFETFLDALTFALSSGATTEALNLCDNLRDSFSQSATLLDIQVGILEDLSKSERQYKRQLAHAQFELYKALANEKTYSTTIENVAEINQAMTFTLLDLGSNSLELSRAAMSYRDKLPPPNYTRRDTSRPRPSTSTSTASVPSASYQKSPTPINPQPQPRQIASAQTFDKSVPLVTPGQNPSAPSQNLTASGNPQPQTPQITPAQAFDKNAPLAKPGQNPLAKLASQRAPLPANMPSASQPAVSQSTDDDAVTACSTLASDQLRSYKVVGSRTAERGGVEVEITSQVPAALYGRYGLCKEYLGDPTRAYEITLNPDGSGQFDYFGMSSRPVHKIEWGVLLGDGVKVGRQCQVVTRFQTRHKPPKEYPAYVFVFRVPGKEWQTNFIVDLKGKIIIPGPSNSYLQKEICPGSG